MGGETKKNLMDQVVTTIIVKEKLSLMLCSNFKAMEKFSPHAYDGKQKVDMEKNN